MVCSRAVFNIVERKDVIVLHLKVSAIIVETLACIPVVAGVDVQFIVKNVACRVGHIITWEKISGLHDIIDN